MTIGALWCWVMAPMKVPRRCTSLPISPRRVCVNFIVERVDVDFRAGRNAVGLLRPFQAHRLRQLEDDGVVALDQAPLGNGAGFVGAHTVPGLRRRLR